MNEIIYRQEKDGYRYTVSVTRLDPETFVASRSISAKLSANVSPTVEEPKQKTFSSYDEAKEYADVLWIELKEQYNLE